MADKSKKPDIEMREAELVRMRGALAPESVNADARTVTVDWTTGAAVRRWDWDNGSYNEELSLDPKHVRMGRLNNGAPFLADHNGYSVTNTLGVVESARLESGKGVATVRFPKAGLDPRADLVFEKIRDGIIQNVSVGYRVHKMEKVDSSDPKIPTYRAIDWEPFEISAVAIGADDGAGFRSFVTRGEPQLEKNAMDEIEKAAAEAKAKEEKQRALEAEKLAARKEEMERISGIQSACRAGGLGEDFAKNLIDGGVKLDVARAQVLEAIAERSAKTEINGHQPAIQVGEEDRDKWVRGATAGMLSRSGGLFRLAAVLDDHKARDSRTKNQDLLNALRGFDPTENGGEFRGFTLGDLARESLERRGIKVRGMSTEKVVERAIYARDNGGQQTASDFSVALENVMYKTLLGEYAQQADSWRRFCGVDSVQDFRNSNRYRLGSFGTLDQLDESGEYKAKQIPDAVKQTISTSTYGNKIALSRKAIVNDDMGAVVASAARFGRMAGLSVEVAVYNLLAQNGGLGPSVTYNGITAPLFDTQFANISTGAAFSMTAIDLDRVKMASQVDISNNEKLDIRPNVLLVPLSLESPAKALNRDAYDPTPGAAFQAPNYVAGLFRDIVGTPRLSGTRRYLFSDQTPGLLVVFLNGVQVPLMDQRQGWDIDGIEWKIRFDFNAQGFDPKGALTNAGA